jgi:uncharacterized protein YlxW (UPF0749 family)
MPSTVPVQVLALQLNDAITEIHKVLKSYRDHEARENLCMEMQKQLESAQSLEQDLANCIRKVRTELSSFKDVHA